MELKFILEALLFSSQKPLSPGEVRELLTRPAEPEDAEALKPFRKIKPEEIAAALETLAAELDAQQRSYRLACVAGAWQFVTRPEYGPWLKALVGVKARPPRLSQPALETLAIIAYRQPLTRAEIEQIRGVSVDGVMQTLTERGLVTGVGKADIIGRPSLYGTTTSFLEYFGLRSIEDLPAADELRRLPVSKPATLATAEPGLAVPPPQELSQESAGTAAPNPTDAPPPEIPGDPATPGPILPPAS